MQDVHLWEWFGGAAVLAAVIVVSLWIAAAVEAIGIKRRVAIVVQRTPETRAVPRAPGTVTS